MGAEFRTIVGGRSRGDRFVVDFPRGVEVLLKKARVDPAFRRLLLQDPVRAAASIELDLGAHEQQMLVHTPRSVLDQMVAHTFVPRQLVETFRGATRAAALVLALASTVVTPSLATAGIETYPSYSADHATLAVDRMASVQNALEEFCRDHGRYPDTEEWREQAASLLQYLGVQELYDPWTRQFHYEAVEEGGRIVNYRLESLGQNEASDRDNIPCPNGAMLHRFGTGQPIRILFPEPDSTIPIGKGESGVTVEFRAECDTEVDVTWWIDGQRQGRTVGEHNRMCELKPGKHVLLLADAYDHVLGLRFFVAVED